MQHALLKEERERLKIQHKQERDKRVCDRIKAVLLRDEGWTHEQIAHVLLLTDAAVRQHISDYQGRYLKARELLIRIVSMLTKMAQISS